MCLVETLEFQTSQRSEASFSFSAQYFRMANYSEVVGSTDLIFGMQGALRGDPGVSELTEVRGQF